MLQVQGWVPPLMLQVQGWVPFYCCRCRVVTIINAEGAGMGSFVNTAGAGLATI